MTSLFSFGRERVEILAASVFISGKPGLEQTPETKSAANMQRASTVWTFVRLVRGKRISKAKEIHLGKVKSGHHRKRCLQHMSTKFRLEGAVPSEPEVRFGIERVSKHFYGNWWAKSQKNLRKRKKISLLRGCFGYDSVSLDVGYYSLSMSRRLTLFVLAIGQLLIPCAAHLKF